MKNPKEIQCPVCKKTRLVDYRNVHKIEKGEISERCFKCSRMKKGQSNGGGFRRGAIPWNKNTKGLMPETWNKGLKGFGAGEKNGMWKGNDVSYTGLHIWIANKRGKPHYCEHCKRSDLPHRSYHWANISRKYKRDVSDWIRLCVKCHSKYDKKLNLGEDGLSEKEEKEILIKMLKDYYEADDQKLSSKELIDSNQINTKIVPWTINIDIIKYENPSVDIVVSINEINLFWTRT